MLVVMTETACRRKGGRNILARLFAAIEVSVQQKHELFELQNKLKNRMEGVRWVRPEGLHLTLKFFGEVEDIKIEFIKQAIKSTALSTEVFNLKYGGFGVFPSPDKARVIWAGLSEGASDVTKMAADLEDNLSGKGFTPEKRLYQPHLTLGRLRYALPENYVRMIIEEQNSFRTSAKAVDSLVLFESRLLRQGAVYTPLYEASFKK